MLVSKPCEVKRGVRPTAGIGIPSTLLAVGPRPRASHIKPSLVDTISADSGRSAVGVVIRDHFERLLRLPRHIRVCRPVPAVVKTSDQTVSHDIEVELQGR